MLPESLSAATQLRSGGLEGRGDHGRFPFRSLSRAARLLDLKKLPSRPVLLGAFDPRSRQEALSSDQRYHRTNLEALFLAA